jgi:transposase
MKTQLAKPVRTKASYTDQYKEEALELWRASGRIAAKVAAELGIRPPLLYRWAQLERAPQKVEGKPKRSVAELEAEIRRLRAENAKLLEQRAPFPPRDVFRSVISIECFEQRFATDLETMYAPARC